MDNPVMDSVFGAGKEPGEQGSVEWLMQRVGMGTASRFRDAVDVLKNGKPSAKRTAYMWELVIERITGQPAQHYESVAMQHGTEMQPRAIMAFESRTGIMTMETGFHKHPTIAMCGGSPDFLIDDDGGGEAKCPFNSANHLQCFISGMPEEHREQVQGCMSIMKRKYWWFISYDPRMPPPLDLFMVRIERDDEYILSLEAGISAFLAEVASLHGQIMEAVS